MKTTKYQKRENEKNYYEIRITENKKMKRKKLLRNTENKKMKNEKIKKKLLRNTENKSINVIDWRIASFCERNLVYGRPMLSNYWQNNCYIDHTYVQFWELL